MKTAQNVTRTGMARAKGEHLQAANDTPKPSEMKLWLHRGWRYIRSDETRVEDTWRRFGWTPPARVR